MGVDFIDYILADRVRAAVRPAGPLQRKDRPSARQLLGQRLQARMSRTRFPRAARSACPKMDSCSAVSTTATSSRRRSSTFGCACCSRSKAASYGLLRTSEAATRNLRSEASARGVDPARLVFAPKVEISHHLARHRLADLFLDNLPVNAHTAASDALWVGLPVLTCIRPSFVGRVAASLLHAVGLPELVTRGLDEYEALALKLATDPASLVSIRNRIERPRCPLCSTPTDCAPHRARIHDDVRERLRARLPRSFAIEAIEGARRKVPRGMCVRRRQ